MKALIRPLLFAVTLLIAGQSTAADVCWQREIDPYTKKHFADESSYRNIVYLWDLQKPKTPSLIALGAAYAIYRSEKNHSLNLGSDKRAHCYLGCRFAQTTSIATALYLGWKKEEQDIKDCNDDSNFDPQDDLATAKGARATSSLSPSAKACEQFCLANFN